MMVSIGKEERTAASYTHQSENESKCVPAIPWLHTRVSRDPERKLKAAIIHPFVFLTELKATGECMAANKKELAAWHFEHFERDGSKRLYMGL